MPDRDPIVVDLDGTLVRTDTLIESIVGLVRRSPIDALRLPVWFLRGRAFLKAAVAARSLPDPALLPYEEELRSFLERERATGRRLVLATAAHQRIADMVAAHVGLFDTVLATNGAANLKGTVKLEAIRACIGSGTGFVYAGDSASDLPIWQRASAAILVGVTPAIASEVRRQCPVLLEIDRRPAGPAMWIRAIRTHQWLKNLLLFVPLLTAFAFTEVGRLLTIANAFFAFSLAASASYLLNDIWDLENDRVHPRKRDRPVASGRLPIQHALVGAAALLLLAFAIAALVSARFTAVLATYLVLTSGYSLSLKNHVVLDVVMLSVLYTLRIVAGSMAIAVPVSSWLLAFSIFLFLSLALVKRCAELLSLAERNETAPKGRDYRVGDLVVLWPLGVGSALCAAVVFGLFINSPETQARYATPSMLWFVAVGLIYWMSRLWIKTCRGEMHDDPVVYAFEDRGSRLTIIVMLALVLSAHFFTLGTPA